MVAERKYDVALFGATGFTGRLTAQYLARHAPAQLRWALAGRNLQKLEQVRAQLADGAGVSAIDLLQADVDDADSIRRVAESARVVITTVGPYILYGEPLVAACAAAGTDYVDLTGEPEFVDLMWLRYHEQARKTGARLVHCCGFDSIPHDLGALFTVQQLPRGVPIKLAGFVRAGGTFSAGTYHSAINAFARLRQYAQVRRERARREGKPDDRRVVGARVRVHREKSLGAWAVPMPTIDPQIVLRSARALEIYGPEFSYGHYLQVKTLAGVMALAGGVGALVAAAQLKPTREWLLKRKSSGEGPSEAQRSKAWFRVRFVGETADRRVVTEVSGGDPGYGETSKMLAESALCLALEELPKTGGQLTPAVAMGDALIGRLRRAGIEFRVLETS